MPERSPILRAQLPKYHSQQDLTSLSSRPRLNKPFPAQMLHSALHLPFAQARLACNLLLGCRHAMLVVGTSPNEMTVIARRGIENLQKPCQHDQSRTGP